MLKMQRYKIHLQYDDHTYKIFMNGFGPKDALDKAMIFIDQERSMQGFSFRVWYPTRVIMKVVK